MSTDTKTYFFCGIGGSGMMPLAVLLKKSSHRIFGSDRSYDQGKTPDKFKALSDLGIEMLAQDGSGVSDVVDMLVVSSAIENTIPDVRAALEKNIRIIKRGELLAECFNTAEYKIAIAGTSGKSTVTGLVGTMLAEMGNDPTVVNGGEIRNFRVNRHDKFSGVRKGQGKFFVAEMDESDGSIAHYIPSVAILNNISFDHKTMEELEQLFGDYIARAESAVIANYDQPRVKSLCSARAKARVISYAIEDRSADLVATDLQPRVDGITFTLRFDNKTYPVHLNIPGRHNVENALAALTVCVVIGADLERGIEALKAFHGIHRRMEHIGTRGAVTVIDDFAHNPDKIAASLQTLKTFEGRLIVIFQPHGFGPLRLMGAEMVDVFAKYLDAEDIVLMPEAYYAGGTVDRSVTAQHLINDLIARGVHARWFAAREEIPVYINRNARVGDRIVVMGARDDTLHDFAHGLLNIFS